MDEDIAGAESMIPEGGSLSYIIEGIVRGMDYHVWVRAKKGDAVKDLPPVDTLIPAAFNSFEALAAFLEAAPQNSIAAPYYVAMTGLVTADLNKVIDDVDISMGALFSALRGRYATVDLRDMAGPAIPAVVVQADMDRDKLTGVILPETLEDLGADVFGACASLVFVEFGGNLISIGDRAFQSSGLKTLELPDSLQTIGADAFAGTALETLELSPGLTNIGGFAFSIPTLTHVDFRTGNPGTASLSIEGSFAGCTALKTARLPDNLDSLGYGARSSASFANCPALELLSIPATTNSIFINTAQQSGSIRFETRGAGKVGTALEGRVLTQLGGTVWITAPGLGGGEIEVSEGVIEITQDFFSGNTELRGITLPSTLTVINRGLFEGCSALEQVMINGAIRSIGDMAFFGCSALGSINLPESLQYIGFRAFYSSGLRSIIVPSKVEGYGPGPGGLDSQPFTECRLLEYADIRTPHLAPLMFADCSELKEISLAPETKEIAFFAFRGCEKLEKINPGGGRDINLSPGLEAIRLHAFGYCRSLGGELELPPGLRTFESVVNFPYDNPFYDCSGITRLILPGSLDLNPTALEGLDSVESFGLNGTGDALRVSPEGKLLIKGDAVILTAKTLGDITIPAGVRDYTKLSADTSLTGLVFEEDSGRTSISQNAFKGCVSLVRVSLSSAIQVINNSAFDDCVVLEELIITNAAALTYPVDRAVFRNCAALTTIKVPQSQVETYQAYSRWRIRPPGVVGSPYLSELIIGY
jgi:hypothetical protein